MIPSASQNHSTSAIHPSGRVCGIGRGALQNARRFPKRDTDHGKPWTVRFQPIREMLYGFVDKPLLLQFLVYVRQIFSGSLSPSKLTS